jgi:endo-alpha-1,4-polygalactosaminidase (GH114 family)
MPEHKRRAWKNDEIKRQNFEDIIRNIFQEYKDNMLISKQIADEILQRITTEIRKQLRGL